MAVTLDLLKKINKKLDAAVSVASSGDGLKEIRVARPTRGSGCIVRYGAHDCFVSHWFDDADEMTQCLIYIKGAMKSGCTELDLYQFAFSVLSQAPPSRSDVVWLYFLNLSKLFADIKQIQSNALWEKLLLGIKDRFREPRTDSAVSASTAVYNLFEVQVTAHAKMTMIYVGLKGCGSGPNYLISENETEFPVLDYKSYPENDTPDCTYYPTWFCRTDLKWTESLRRRRDGIDLRWIEPSREAHHRTDHANFATCITAVLALFRKDTPYTVIGSTLNSCMCLCPRTTNDRELRHRNEGMHHAFIFRENPLEYVINDQDFVLAIAAVELRLWGYTPVNTQTYMECQVTLNYLLLFEPETNDEFYDLQNATAPNFDITPNVSYKGIVTDGDFIILRSTRSEEDHSAADSEPGDPNSV